MADIGQARLLACVQHPRGKGEQEQLLYTKLALLVDKRYSAFALFTGLKAMP